MSKPGHVVHARERGEVSTQLNDDPVMRVLVSRYGTLSLERRPPFLALSRSIIAQQISTRAADTIRERLASAVGLLPTNIVSAPMPVLRALGLSQAKASCLQEVAKRVTAGDFSELDELTDDSISSRLREIRGVGPWTAEMFLIFSLARPNVWPVSDAGLRAAARRLYRVTGLSAVRQLGDRFEPVRSSAALYLWRSLENTKPTATDRAS